MTAMKPEALDQIRRDMSAALAQVEKTHGLQFDIGRISYDDDGFRAPLKAMCTVASDGSTIDPQKVEFCRYAPLFGITEEDYLTEFMHGGNTIVLTGLKPNSPTWSVLGRRVDNGKTYRFKRAVVDRIIAQKSSK